MTCSASLQTWKMLTRGFFATSEQGGTNHTEYTASDCRLCLKNKTVLLCLTLLFSRSIFWTHSIVTFVPAPSKCFLFWWRISLSRLQPCSECHLASPAEVSCCSRFLKLNNHRVQSHKQRQWLSTAYCAGHWPYYLSYCRSFLYVEGLHKL